MIVPIRCINLAATGIVIDANDAIQPVPLSPILEVVPLSLFCDSNPTVAVSETALP